ncbi:TonB-dependent receptor plug domain-containing protein [Mucilaginibacter xinganensis]|uniref:Vitamin B12 transporter BtuB n=1 Tax=Mucilaginibacter xinganensis TaxID=1234841 RepID=A0A223NXV6_9SPHI|nr:TonB-dependent receptor [Mucilaginibacter xinganensis]ASU34656.1 Vitamin B12 transporter BtuB precursor [Mucilaginibacter xinganensis]
MKKNYFFIIAGLGLAQSLLFSKAAYAQDSTRVLNDVVVTATRSAKKQSEIGRVVTVITSEQINRSAGKTLPQLLNTVPGITFSGSENAPGISSSVYLRGASTGNTLILVDGFAVNNSSSIEGAYDLNAFPLDQIERIEILKGSGSTLYGSDAVAGVINIITKHPKEQGLKTNLQASGGTYNTFNQAAGLNGKINKTGIALNLSNTDSKGFAAATDTLGTGNFKKDGFHQRSASLNLTQQVSEKFMINGNLQASYNKGNLPAGAFTDDQGYTYNNTFIFGGIGGKLQLDKGDLKFNISQNSVKNNYNDLAGASNFNTASYQKNSGSITNFDVLLNYNINKYLDITSGESFRYYSSTQLSTYDTLKNLRNSINSIYTSLFFKAGIFHMELGGRYNLDSKYGTNFTYTVNPSLYLADQFKVFGTIASAFKTPSLYQLFSQYGNDALRPETTTSYEAGFDWELIKNTLSFNTVFYKYDTKDVIYFKNLADAPYGIYENGSFQKDKGFESELKLNLDKFTASAYAAYVTGKQTDVTGKETNNLYRRPKNTFGANVYYQFIKSFSAGLNYKYTGDRSDTKFNADYSSSIVTLKHYNLVDAHLQYDVDKHLGLFADLKNLFNAKYTDWVGYNTRGFNFMAGIRYRVN